MNAVVLPRDTLSQSAQFGISLQHHLYRICPYVLLQHFLVSPGRRESVNIQMENSRKGKCTCRDSNLRHRFAKQMEITRTSHHAIAPSSKKKTAQWRTSSTHVSIHTGVIGRCFHVHLAHQIHGANLNSLLFPEGQPMTLVETPNPRCQWTMILQRMKEGSENKFNEKSPKSKCTCRDSNLRHQFT